MTVAAYEQVRNHEFINFDDDLYVTDNQRVQAGLTLEGVVWAFSFNESGYFQPLTCCRICWTVSFTGSIRGRSSSGGTPSAASEPVFYRLHGYIRRQLYRVCLRIRRRHPLRITDGLDLQ